MNQYEYKKFMKEKYSLEEDTYNRLRQVFRGMKQRCNNPKKVGYFGLPYPITLDELFTLWNRDKGWLLKQPSIDRINPNQGYIYQNCRFIELELNNKLARKCTPRFYKAIKNRIVPNKKAVLQIDKNSKVINTFKSISEAENKSGIIHIGAVCNGQRKFAGGFKWKFK